jgi:rod shape-determining protein MreC
LAVALISGLLAVLGFAGPVKTVLGTVAKPFSLVGTMVSDAFNGFYEVFFDYEKLKAENESLRAELELKNDESYDAQMLRVENEWLKQYINFTTEHPDLKLADARVIAREANNYSTVLTLNRGVVHGVKAEAPVITEEGLLGHVTEVGLDWCKVVCLTAPEASVAAYVERSSDTGIVNGDTDLKGDGSCYMTYIDSSADIRIGDRIYTSGGANSSYPSGIYIGEISAFEADPETRTLKATVKTGVDFSELKSVSRLMIITGYNEGDS